MKNLIKSCFTFSVLSVLLLSCKKDEDKVYFQGGTNPILSASSTAALVLSSANKNNPAVTFSWTNPNYQFNTGSSSQDVTYTLQVDTTGANFTNPLKQEKSIPKDLSITLTEGDVNLFLTKMSLASGVAHNIDFRIKATLANNNAPLYSNVVKISINNYLDFAVEPPGTPGAQYLDGNLWVVGDAVASGWSNPLPAPYDVTQKIIRKVPTDVLIYRDTITFNATGGYKLIQTQGVWATQYHAMDGTAKLTGDFEKKDSDPQFPSPGAGDYIVEFNFQTGKYTLTKL